MTIYANIIKSIDPNADADLVMDVADELFRYFGEMSRADWAECVAIANESGF